MNILIKYEKKLVGFGVGAAADKSAKRMAVKHRDYAALKSGIALP